MLDGLERTDWAPELHPRRGVLHGGLKQPFGPAHHFVGERHGAQLQGRRQRFAAAARFADKSPRRVLQRDFGELARRVQCRKRTPRHPRRLRFNCVQGDAAGFPRRHHQKLRCAAVHHMALDAVERPVAHSRLNALSVPAPIPLSEGQRGPAFPGGDGWQQFVLVRLAAGVEDGGGGEHGRREVRPAVERPSHLFEHDGEFREREPLAAVPFGNVDAAQRQVRAEPPPDFAIVARVHRHQPPRFARRRALAQEAPYRVAQLRLFFAEDELHHADSAAERRRGRSTKSPARRSRLARIASCISAPCRKEAFQMAM